MGLPCVYVWEPIMSESLLIIDDDVRLSQMLVDYLGAGGYQISCAHTGKTGLQLAKQQN